MLWALGAILAACDGAVPVEARVEPVEGDAPVVNASPVATQSAPRAAPLDSALADLYPSLEHYPTVEGPLLTMLERGGAREILVALAASMAPYRWPSMTDWDRHGFIALSGPVSGYVTRVPGGVVSQPSDRHDLGCAGGFLEGVRLTLSPRLGIEDLDRCEAAQRPVEGAPAGCDPDHEYGWIALKNIAARLDARQLPAGARLIEVDVHHEAGLAALAAPGAMHLCTVSHVSATREHSRFFHHMMIVLGTAEGEVLDVFDTTGARGVSVVTMPRERFIRYCTVLLRNNREFRYVGRSTRLTCLPVARGAAPIRAAQTVPAPR